MIEQKILNITKIIPSYWPIGSFIHHNPLSGFEQQKFKDGLKNAKEVFDCKVYMPSDYYVDLYNEDKVNKEIFDKNLLKLLEKSNLQDYFKEAKVFLLEVSPNWKYHRSFEKTSTKVLNEELFSYLKDNFIYTNYDILLKSLIKSMTLYEINDAIFDTNLSALIQKDIIEYTSRYLDEEQTTLTMHQRELGMFTAFKYYENFKHDGTSLQYIQEILSTFCIENEEDYLLTHLLKLSGWSGFIKYRSSNKDYYFQQLNPSSIEDFLAIRLHYEMHYMQNSKINSFDKFNDYYNNNKAFTILKLLKYKLELDNIYADRLENFSNYDDILNSFIEGKVKLDTLQLQSAHEVIGGFKENCIEYHKFIEFLKEEEGYLWLKTIEDGHIDTYIDKILEPKIVSTSKPLASAVFCIDVRSEVMRRFIEKNENYNTYGMAGFLGIPIAFVEFDKGHEQFLCPGIVKAKNIIFELPEENHDEYTKQKGSLKIFKKVLSDLKNNPYSPFIMVEAVGWLFGIKLFGKTFFPNKMKKLFARFKPKHPRTIYTIDQLSQEDIQKYAKKLHLNLIKTVCYKEGNLSLSEENVLKVWKHIIFKEKLEVNISDELLEKLTYEHNITNDDYEFQKSKLTLVGFPLIEQIDHIQRILKTMGLTKDFPKFVLMISHNSISDNNPFESALDCGACGGNASLPNIRAFVMMINKQDVKDGLKERGINIPDDTTFIPAIHNTTTDSIDFIDTHTIKHEDKNDFEIIVNDFKIASVNAREERLQVLPYTSTQDDMFTKSMDWSETRPEWGLAGNTMAYVGNRQYTKGINLNNKMFLQSYDHTQDNENVDLLTRLYDGPLVVGEWINMEHYFSTVDNKIFGAGSKVYHNVVSKVGVFSGNYSDLKIGLASQSVLLEGKAYHEPIRLIVFLEAPLQYGLKAVENSKLGGHVIMNEWIRLVVIDTEAKKVYLLDDGEMEVIREL